MRNGQRDGCLAHAAVPDDGNETLGDELFADEADGIVAPSHVCQTLGKIIDRCVERRFDVRRGAFVRNRGAKTITAALHVGDVMLAGLSSINRFAQRSDVHAETDFFHNDVRPNLGNEILVSDHFSGAFDQRQQNIESPGTQLDGVVPFLEKTLR
ncbi:hypothetical protein V1289_009456 [Bradyrhizobium sp. AZCC 2289]